MASLMSPTAASFNNSIVSINTSNTTVIGLSAFENAHTENPPTVTGTVIQVQETSDEEFDINDYDDDDDEVKSTPTRGYNRNDSMWISELDVLDKSMDPMMCVERNLKIKAAEILRLNPWLASTIVRQKFSRRASVEISRRASIEVQRRGSNNEFTRSIELTEDSQHSNGSERSRDSSGGKKNPLIGIKLNMEFPTELTEIEAQQRAERVVRIVTSTALGGFVKKKSATKEKLGSMAPSALSLIIADPISDNKYKEIIDIVRPMLHSSTDDVVGKDENLWDVILIPMTVSTTSQPSGKFLLVHSLNFCIADPATLYKIYSMLISEKPVQRLDPSRSENIEAIKRDILGGDPNFMRSKGMQKGWLGALKSQTKPHPTSLWMINDEKIKAIKETSISGSSVPFVSTNDILTSWFLSRNKNAAIGCLVADIRGKSFGVPNNKAGNYQTEIVYNTSCYGGQETRTPACIRASVMRDDELLKRCGDKELPDAKTISGGFFGEAHEVSIVSNWSGLCGEGIFQNFFLAHGDGLLELDTMVHFPIVFQRKKSVLKASSWNQLVVFRYTEDKLGILVTAPPSATEGDDLPFDKPALFLS